MLLAKRIIRKLKRGILGISILLCVLSLVGCSTEAGDRTETQLNVRVVATTNFGKELLFDEILEVPAGTSAMAALQQVAEVESTYGRGFVSSINGIRSQRNSGDWLVYLNGISSNVGALDYTLSDGDVQHWDHHAWGFRMFIPANIGFFPEPFLGGFEGRVYPTIVLYQTGLKDDADKIVDTLEGLGVEKVSTMNMDDLSKNTKQSANIILLCTADNELITELNGAWNRLGFFIHFGDNELVVYDSKGGVYGRYSAGAGIIQATQNPWNPDGIGVCENVVWMLSGMDEGGVKKAVDTLINGYEKYRYSFSIVITADGHIVKVPP